MSYMAAISELEDNTKAWSSLLLCFRYGRVERFEFKRGTGYRHPDNTFKLDAFCRDGYWRHAEGATPEETIRKLAADLERELEMELKITPCCQTCAHWGELKGWSDSDGQRPCALTVLRNDGTPHHPKSLALPFVESGAAALYTDHVFSCSQWEEGE